MSCSSHLQTVTSRSQAPLAFPLTVVPRPRRRPTPLTRELVTIPLRCARPSARHEPCLCIQAARHSHFHTASSAENRHLLLELHSNCSLTCLQPLPRAQNSLPSWCPHHDTAGIHLEAAY